MKNIKKYIPILSIIIVFTLLGGMVGGLIFASDNNPTIVIGGKSNNAMPMFTEDLGVWYPGYYDTRSIKIKNDKNIDAILRNIGMNISLDKDSIDIDLQDMIGMEYLENMDLKIEYKNKNPFNKSGNKILYDGNFKNFLQGIGTEIIIEGKREIELQYTIGMNKVASSNIEGIEGNIDFTFQIEQNIDFDEDVEAPDYVDIIDEKIPKGSDIEEHWAHDCIVALVEKGIIRGYPDGTIRPENNITRAEAAVLAGRAIGINLSSSLESKYKDELPLWAKEYILALTDLGVLHGYENGEFRANNYITREEMIKILVLSFEKESENLIELQFLDNDDIGSWAVNYVKIGVENKIIVGYPDNTFRPKKNITRGETFTIICKLLGLHEVHKNK